MDGNPPISPPPQRTSFQVRKLHCMCWLVNTTIFSWWFCASFFSFSVMSSIPGDGKLMQSRIAPLGWPDEGICPVYGQSFSWKYSFLLTILVHKKCGSIGYRSSKRRWIAFGLWDNPFFFMTEWLRGLKRLCIAYTFSSSLHHFPQLPILIRSEVAHFVSLLGCRGV